MHNNELQINSQSFATIKACEQAKEIIGENLRKYKFNTLNLYCLPTNK